MARSAAAAAERSSRRTSERYLDAFRRITGAPLDRRGAIVNFAREGLIFIGIAAFIAVGAFGLALARRSWSLWLLAFDLTLVALWVAYFFRDPHAPASVGALVVAPADGKIVMITEVDEPTFMQGARRFASRSS